MSVYVNMIHTQRGSDNLITFLFSGVTIIPEQTLSVERLGYAVGEKPTHILPVIYIFLYCVLFYAIVRLRF